jgi:hypothetical protein
VRRERRSLEISTLHGKPEGIVVGEGQGEGEGGGSEYPVR